MATTEHSAQYAHLLRRWQQERISLSMLQKYVMAKRITAKEYEEITGEAYPVEN